MYAIALDTAPFAVVVNDGERRSYRFRQRIWVILLKLQNERSTTPGKIDESSEFLEISILHLFVKCSLLNS